MASSRPSFIRKLQSRENAPNWPVSTAAWFVFAYMALWIASLSIISVLTGEITGTLPTSRTLALSSLLSGLVFVLGTFQWARLRVGVRWPLMLRLTEPVQRNTLFLIVLLGLGLAWLIDLAGVVLRLREGLVVPPLLQALRDSDAVGWMLTALVALVIQPLAEGLVFAGVLYPSMTKVFRDNAPVIAICTLIYTIVALLLSPVPSTWYALLHPFLMGLVMFGTRAYYQSTRAAILIRAAFGLFFILAALFGAGFLAA